ncbi:MAG: hypothetical protein RLY45_1792 [Actinomycetota bacterium]
MKAEFVVVGGGSGGCAVAGRLAEAGRDVVLLEAGPDYGPVDSGRWPAEFLDARAMPVTSHDWGYTADRWRFERARIIGGCSSHNGAIAAVGQRQEYDDWKVPGWSGNDVAPVFQRVLQRMRVRAYERTEAGPFHERCLQAAESLGWTIASDLCDLDAGDSFGLETVNVVGATRWNAAFAYLDPVRDRLRIVDEAIVATFDWGEHGVKVTVLRRGEPVTIEAGTLVLAAGAYGSPALLERSGIGNPAALVDAGVTCRKNLMGVGANLQDHPMVHADRAVGPQLQQWLDAAAATGFLPEEQTLGKFTSDLSADGRYDLHVFPVCASDQTSALHGKVHVEVAVLNPASRGSVHIASGDPEQQPKISHKYLSDRAGRDLQVLRRGVKVAEQLLSHPHLASVLGDRITDMHYDAAYYETVSHYYHPAGSCAMGDTFLSVVDERARVRGVPNVRIADASIMPFITRANTNLPTVMIGERVADFLLEDTAGR